jgi:LysM repeat protein
MRKTFLFICVSFIFNTQANEVFSNSKKEYVTTWSDIAVEQMMLYKIPASITLAQGILESGSGTSKLATEGNNHFGIKCHGWTGKAMYHDDDEKGECFRVYESAKESYEDHSKFLTDNKRYNSLFEMEITDYSSWANGLKSAGYATNPKYAEQLIALIEELDLSSYDKQTGPSLASLDLLIEDLEASNKMKHSVLMKENKVKYVIARKGDTFFRISKEFGIGLWQLYKYNDFDQTKDVLEEGDIVYIYPKRKWSKKKFTEISYEMTLREFSQQEAISLKKLMKCNEISNPDEKLVKGEKIILR